MQSLLVRGIVTKERSLALIILKRCLATDASPGTGRMTDLSGLGPKRFYKEVDVQRHDSLHAVTVDGKLVKTPRRHVLATPSQAFSTAVAAEWDAQVGRIRPSSMPLTGLASAALDIVPEFRQRMSDSILRFLHTDTACIRPDTPRELVAAQDAAFQPVVQHAEGSGIPINVVRGALIANQNESAEKWVLNIVRDLDNWSLAAMDSVASCAKSVLVAIALKDGAISPQQALHAARSEEMWQSKVWGVVEGGHDMDDADASVRLSAAHMVFRFIELEKDTFRSSSTK